MDESHEAGFLSAKLDEAWARRVTQANDWNLRLEVGSVNPNIFLRLSWTFRAIAGGRDYRQRFESLEKHWRSIGGRKTPSLAWSLNDVFAKMFWVGGAFKVRRLVS